MRLALTGLFRARWSADVHEEWMTNLLRNQPDLSRAKLERTRMLMDKHAVGALVTGYESLIESLWLPDPNDRHVLAAAICGRTDIIVTANTRDFPVEIIGAFGIEVQHPDEFVVNWLNLAPNAVMAAAEEHRQSLKNPSKTTEEYFEMLKMQGLTQTALKLQELSR